MIGRRIARPALLAVMACSLLAAISPGESFYSYTNRQGQIVFSNRLPPQDQTGGAVTRHEITRDNPQLLQFDEERFNRFDDLIHRHARTHEVDFNLVKAVILMESNFNPAAVSPKGAMGLMQLMPATARRLGVSDPHDPDDNIRGGTSHLRSLIEEFDGDLSLVLAAYNAGENLVRRIRRVPNYAETKRYVAKIIEIYGRDRTQLTPGSPTPGQPRFYRYLDARGVMVLSNVPPPAGARPLD